MPSHSQTPPEVFVSYSHLDKGYKDDLVKQLNILQRQGVISNWHDGLLVAGEKWNEQIVEHLNSSRIILLLISPDFMNSDYIHNVELKRASERHQAGAVSVIPVLVRNVNSWENEPFGDLTLGDFQALPTGLKFIIDWHNRDKAFTDVAKGIQQAVEKLRLSNMATRIPALVPRPPVVGFVARRDDQGRDLLERLKEELAPEKNQLVALWGAGGVGKTTIAAEAVRSLIEATNQRVVWTTADGRVNFAFSTLLDDIAEQLGRTDLRPLAVGPKEEALRPIITENPTLIVLDNLETISPEEELLCKAFLAFRARCPGLITTRERIDNAHLITIAAMSPDEAGKLLAKLIEQTHDPDIYAEVDRNRILEAAEFNPLIIQWIVGQIDLAQDPEEVLSELAKGEGDAAERVFDRSFNLPQMAQGGRAVLLALSLFMPSATRPGLAEVSGMAKDKDKKKFRRAQQTLASLWLLKQTDGGKRLAVEGLTRELARTRLSHDPRSKTFRQRYVARFLRYAEANSEVIPSHLNSLEAERDNLLNAMDVAFEIHDWDGVMDLMRAIAFPGMLNTRGYWDDAIRKGEQAMAAALFAGNAAAVAEFAGNTATVSEERGEHSEARGAYQQALNAFSELGSDFNVATALMQLAILSYKQGGIEEARRLYTESLEIWKKLGDQSGIAKTLHLFGVLAHNQGDLEEARRFYSESLEIKNKLGNQSEIATTLHQFGRLAQDQGDIEGARRFYNESLEINKKLGDQKVLAVNLHQFGKLAHDQGEMEEARRLYNESLEISKKLGDQRVIAGTLHQLAALAQAQGDLPEARQLYNESLEIQKKLGNQSGTASTLHNLGKLAEDEGNNGEAARFFGEALEIFEKLKSPDADLARWSLTRVEGRSS